MIWNKDLPGSPISIVGFLQVFSDKMATSLKAPTLPTYEVYVVELRFSRAYHKRVFQSGHVLEAYLLVYTADGNCMRDADICGPRKSVYAYHMFLANDAEGLIETSSNTQRK